MDTIFALATAPGSAGVAVVRVSGPRAHEVGKTMCGSLPGAGRFKLCEVKDHSGAVLDKALTLQFDGPHSFTGEDVIELHLHGSTAVISAVLGALSQFDDMRIAEAGEFTRRALENEKLDLAQVEGLADLIDAETETQRQLAFKVVDGDFSALVENWRRDLIRAASLLEVTIDFADEDVPVDVTPEVKDLLANVLDSLSKQVEGLSFAERVRTGFQVAIIGPPNAGKSSILNALAGREAAITSEFAGTTRDVIEVRMDLNGLPVTFLDTAGIRDSDDHVEKIGIARALSRAKDADLRVFLMVDGFDIPVSPEPDDILVTAKADLTGDPEGVSGLTGQGLPDLTERIRKTLEARAVAGALANRERHRIALVRAIEGLEAATSALEHGEAGYDITAEELRSAVRALETLIGRIDVEALLDEIFSSFCLGK